MMSPEEVERQRKLDEAFTMLHERMPSSWRSIYCRCVEEGFSEYQAMSLIKAHILSQCPYGVHVHKE